MRWFRPSSRRVSDISEAEALRCARDFCDREALPWNEPVKVRRRRRHWVIWTNAGVIGGNVEITVDARTGEVRRRWGPLSR